MPVTLNANSSTGFIATSDTSGVLQLQTGGTTAVTVDASQNVGIGTASPSGRLDVESSSSVVYTNLTATAGGAASVLSLIGGSSSEQAICYNSSALRFGTATGKNAAGFTERMRIDSSGNVGIGTVSPNSAGVSLACTLNASNASTGGIFELNGAGTRYGYLFANASNTVLSSVQSLPLLFSTNNTERMRINAGAPILCLSGGSTSATGTGIAFPATQSASSDANTLDDYEEGTYTMTWTPASGSITLNSGANTVRYTKIGRVVIVTGFVSVASVSSPSGLLTVNLPFTAAVRTTASFLFNLLAAGGNNSTVWPVVDDGGATCAVYVGGGTSVSTTFSAYVQAGTDARISIVYTV